MTQMSKIINHSYFTIQSSSILFYSSISFDTFLDWRVTFFWSPFPFNFIRVIISLDMHRHIHNNNYFYFAYKYIYIWREWHDWTRHRHDINEVSSYILMIECRDELTFKFFCEWSVYSCFRTMMIAKNLVMRNEFAVLTVKKWV